MYIKNILLEHLIAIRYYCNNLPFFMAKANKQIPFKFKMVLSAILYCQGLADKFSVSNTIREKLEVLRQFVLSSKEALTLKLIVTAVRHYDISGMPLLQTLCNHRLSTLSVVFYSCFFFIFHERLNSKRVSHFLFLRQFRIFQRSGLNC